MFKYILFDLDNTLYDYESANKIALQQVLFEISNTFGSLNLNEEYEIEKKKFQNYCNNASSHNKFIQIKKIFEKFNLDLNKLNIYYDLYIDVFKKKLKIFPYVRDFLEFCSSKSIKMYILTNNTCKEQIERLKEMKLIDYFVKIYTSEEFGIEKPDIKLFYYIIQDINCNSNEIVKIGDNYKNDIEPLILNNIYAFWFNKKELYINKEYLEFNCYSKLIKLFEDYYSSLNDFLHISDYAGERFDLVQAGGGNTSFKIKEIMFIKSSGCSLSDICVNKNYVGVDWNNIKKSLININFDDKNKRENISKKIVNSNIIFLKDYRPSIETTLHCLTKKYTIHIHPIQFNYISSLRECNIILKNIFEDYCLIDYFTPGIEVSLELIKKYKQEKIIFMKNHGITITADSLKELKLILNNTINKLESYLQLDFRKYTFVNKITSTLKNIFNTKFISYLVENETINRFVNTYDMQDMDKIFRSYFPDKIVYCGINFVECKENLHNSVDTYFKKYKEIPKIFINIKNKKHIYISSNSLNKCKDIEQVLLSHIMCYKKDNQFLDSNEINYLNNWESEKYRKKL